MSMNRAICPLLVLLVRTLCPVTPVDLCGHPGTSDRLPMLARGDAYGGATTPSLTATATARARVGCFSFCRIDDMWCPTVFSEM